LYCVQSTAMALAASSRTLASFGDALSGGFRSGLSLLGVFMLLLVGYFIFTFVIGIAQLILSFLGSFGEGIVGLASFAAFVYAACRFVVIVPVVAVDGERNPVKAIRRSWEITEGHVLPIFVIVLIVGIAAIGLGVVFGLLFGGLFFATAASGAPALSTIAVMILVFGVFGGVFAVLGAALMVVLHSAVSSSEAEELGKTFE
ncbi:MAG: glycerophosphoryl diester phosphodiesterase membrane domain-containing protein, partial [Pseudomonadota bacterium]